MDPLDVTVAVAARGYVAVASEPADASFTAAVVASSLIHVPPDHPASGLRRAPRGDDDPR